MVLCLKRFREDPDRNRISTTFSTEGEVDIHSDIHRLRSGTPTLSLHKPSRPSPKTSHSLLVYNAALPVGQCQTAINRTRTSKNYTFEADLQPL